MYLLQRPGEKYYKMAEWAQWGERVGADTAIYTASCSTKTTTAMG